MKKEDKRYYALPDGTLREIPADLEVPTTAKIEYDPHLSYHDQWEMLERNFLSRLSNQPAIYTDEKFPVGVVEGIEVKYQVLSMTGEWQTVEKNVYDMPFYKNGSRRLFATRKREEVNTETSESLIWALKEGKILRTMYKPLGEYTYLWAEKDNEGELYFYVSGWGSAFGKPEHRIIDLIKHPEKWELDNTSTPKP